MGFRGVGLSAVVTDGRSGVDVLLLIILIIIVFAVIFSVGERIVFETQKIVNANESVCVNDYRGIWVNGSCALNMSYNSPYNLLS